MTMQRKLVFATNNAHKLEEVAAILGLSLIHIWGYDFVTPPSRRHLYGEHVLGVWLGTDDVCNIIGERCV